jgi:hypothetical protein
MADGDLCTQRQGAISEPERKEKEEVAQQLQDYVTKLVVELIATLRGGIDDSKLDSGGGGARGLFKRRAMCSSSQEEGQGGIGLHRRVRVGYEQEEEEDSGGPRRKPEREGKRARWPAASA